MTLMPSLFSERSVTALVLLLIACGLYYSSLDASYADLGGAFDPTFFPRIILMIWGGLALITLMVEATDRTPTLPFKLVRVLALALLSFAYVLVMPEIGFFLTSVVYCALSLIILDVRRVVTIALFSLLMPGSLVLLFNHILTLPLPTSPFTHLF